MAGTDMCVPDPTSRPDLLSSCQLAVLGCQVLLGGLSFRGWSAIMADWGGLIGLGHCVSVLFTSDRSYAPQSTSWGWGSEQVGSKVHFSLCPVLPPSHACPRCRFFINTVRANSKPVSVSGETNLCQTLLKHSHRQLRGANLGLS